MSFQPWNCGGNFAIPSTIPGESSGAYSIVPAVWWTNAIWTAPYLGPERGGT